MTKKNYELEVLDLHKYFKIGRREHLRAVDGISFNIEKGETLGIVGESGSGKTTAGKSVIGMLDINDGKILYRGKDISTMSKKEKFDFTRNVQMVFQDPYASLDPRQKVYDIISEGIRIHKLAKNKKEEEEKVFELLDQVGLQKEHANRFAHEFSGGQRQRIGIARALSVEPDFLFCDEPISALDVSIQAQIVNLLVRLKEERNLTMLFIAHDLSMVSYISDRVGVMYLGNLMELTDPIRLYKKPLHPYTEALLSAIPIPDPKLAKSTERIIIEGEIPSPIHPPKGCKFCTRCPKKLDICDTIRPEFKEVEEGHFAACHLYE